MIVEGRKLKLSCLFFHVKPDIKDCLSGSFLWLAMVVAGLMARACIRTIVQINILVSILSLTIDR